MYRLLSQPTINSCRPALIRLSSCPIAIVAFIDSQTGKTERIVMVRPEAGTRIESVGGLVFASYGSRYVLKEVRMTGSSMHSELAIQPKPEPLRAMNSTGTTFEIAMR